MLTRKDSLDRVLTGVMLLAVMLGISIMLYATYAFATLDFTRSMSERKFEEAYRQYGVDATPWVTAVYRQVYPYSWLSLAVAVLWAAWILRKSTCSLLAVVMYVSTFSNLALFWLLFTLMALYLKNQAFHM